MNRIHYFFELWVFRILYKFKKQVHEKEKKEGLKVLKKVFKEKVFKEKNSEKAKLWSKELKN